MKKKTKQTSKYAFKSIIIKEWYQVFPKRFCKAYLPLIPVFDLGAQLDSIAKIVPQSQKKKKILKQKQSINLSNLNVLQKV